MKNMFEPQKLKHHNPQVTRKTLCLDDFEYYSYTLHSYYIYPYYLQNFKETIPKKKKILERFLQHIYLVRESYSSLSENSFVISSPPPLPLIYIDRRFVPKHNSHLFKDTTFSHQKEKEKKTLSLERFFHEIYLLKCKGHFFCVIGISFDKTHSTCIWVNLSRFKMIITSGCIEDMKITQELLKKSAICRS